MPLSVAEISLVSPLGLSPSEHAFFYRAEVTPHTSGAFTNRDGDSLPINDCGWIPATRPWASRIRLLAKQALARVQATSSRTPIVLVAPSAATEGDTDLVRFLSLGGHNVVAVRSGSASYVLALREVESLLEREPEVVLLAVDSLLTPREIEQWLSLRRSGFIRSPLPPSEGAAAMRFLSRAPKQVLAGQIVSFATTRSEATDANDVPADGALGQVLTTMRLPAVIPLVVGPRDVDALRTRDFHLAAVRQHERMDQANMPSLEGKIGLFGSAAGLMSAVFALAWLRHELPHGAVDAPRAKERVALAWARSADGLVGAVLLGDSRS